MPLSPEFLTVVYIGYGRRDGAGDRIVEFALNHIDRLRSLDYSAFTLSRTRRSASSNTAAHGSEASGSRQTAANPASASASRRRPAGAVGAVAPRDAAEIDGVEQKRADVDIPAAGIGGDLLGDHRFCSAGRSPYQGRLAGLDQGRCARAGWSWPANPCFPRSRSTPGRPAGSTPGIGAVRGLRGRDSGICARARSCLAAVMVGQDHVFGNRNEERRNHVFGLAALFRGRADGHGGDRGRGLAGKKTEKEAKIARLAAGQGLERAAMVFRNVGGYGGCLPASGAGGPCSGPPFARTTPAPTA